MHNQYQQLMEVLVRQILKKHNVSPAKNLSDEEKEKIRNTALGLQQQVEEFLKEKQTKTNEEAKNDKGNESQGKSDPFSEILKRKAEKRKKTE
ncbi:hypothetical protein J26TS2_13530 [Shouchella clausii]|uniref:hypothetical protein n=1 Tax=Shouchella tritolerans TaxID=2979466 RepID=UPI00078972D1|nr:hypothetical protein [Shouchella tritolerans]GIN11486.1 hypothetical protein J26TS2_13530 [Shouchella clausii]